MQTYIANLGWLKNSGTNGTTLQASAADDVFKCLDGARLYRMSEREQPMGRVRVCRPLVYVEIDGEAGLAPSARPALIIEGVARETKDGWIVESVSRADLFLSPDDNGNSFTWVSDLSGKEKE
jgi:hypothetical protein